MNFFKSLTVLAATNLSSGVLWAHEVEIANRTKVNYVSHDEVRQEFEVFLAEKRAEEMKAQEMAAEKRREEMRRETFFRGRGRER